MKIPMLLNIGMEKKSPSLIWVLNFYGLHCINWLRLKNAIVDFKTKTQKQVSSQSWMWLRLCDGVIMTYLVRPWLIIILTTSQAGIAIWVTMAMVCGVTPVDAKLLRLWLKTAAGQMERLLESIQKLGLESDPGYARFADIRKIHCLRWRSHL